MAIEKYVFLAVAVIVGLVFALIFWFAEDLPMIAKAFLLFAVAIALIVSVVQFRHARAILKDGRDWQVEITDEMLSWFSPIPEQMESFEVKLSDIASVNQKQIQFRNSDRTPDTTFHIEFTNGRRLKIDPQLCGINPVKVFRALENKGIEFTFTTETKGSKVGIKLG
jgi:hypothetical protein